jgi:hypothetical protein
VTKPTSIALSDDDLDRLSEICKKLNLSRSRAIAIGIAFLFTISTGQQEEIRERLRVVKKPIPLPVVRKKRGWPKGKKRGPRKPKVVPLVVAGGYVD